VANALPAGVATIDKINNWSGSGNVIGIAAHSPSEILMNLNKICDKLICGYCDKWCPVVAENGSPPSTTSGENTGWAENFSMWKIAYKHVEEST